MNRSPRPALHTMAAIVLAAAMLFANASPALGAMSRSLVMARAQRWVDFKIPYSQSTYRTLDNVKVGFSSGWRTDCSGFVSMAWNTPKPGYFTGTIQQTSTQITKAALRPGDAMVNSGNHALIFGGWVDGTHTSYYAYEMSSGQSDRTGDGTVMRVTPYPYWPRNDPGGYLPYRLNGITENIDYRGFIDPIEGANRYLTALAASRSAFANGTVDTIIVASGENWPDALGASSLAGAVGGPVLLTARKALPAGLLAEITRLGASEVIIVGGAPAVSDEVFRAIHETGVSVERLAGIDRYATSTLIAEETVERLKDKGLYDGTVFITTGTNFPDALAASPLAAKSGWPILITNSDTLSPEASYAMEAIGADSAIILGSTTPVSASIEASLVADLGLAEVTRLAGSNRYETAVRIAQYGRAHCGLGLSRVAIATGANFPDALAGGVMAGRGGTLLLLTPSGSLDSNVSNLLHANAAEVGKPRVLGSTAALKPVVREAIALALGATAE